VLDDMIAAADRRDAAKAANNERITMQQRILDELAPYTWAALREALKAKCDQHPTRFVYEVWPTSQVRIRGERAILELNYLVASSRVRYTLASTKGEYRIKLNDENDAVFVDSLGRPPLSPEAVAERLLSELLNA